MKNKFKKLSLNVPERVHANIKKNAKKRHITMTRWIMRCIVEKIIREENS